MSRASDKAYQLIREEIISGRIAPRSRLKEEDLAKLCGVSRTPIRDALRRLEADMLVVRSDTQRSYVPALGRDDVTEIFQLRTMMEGYAAERAASRITPEQLQQLKAFDEEITKAVGGEKKDYEAFVHFNRMFHDLIVEAAQAPRLARVLELLVEQPLLQRPALRLGFEGVRHSHAGHQDIISALEANDPQWAKDSMQAHVRHALHTTIINEDDMNDDAAVTPEVLPGE